MSEKFRPTGDLTRRQFLVLGAVVLTNPKLLIENQEQRPARPALSPIYWGDRTRPNIALTFDDGYSQKAINITLKELRTAGLNCTFFVVGTQLKAYSSLWQQAVEDGHQICNHTYSHAFLGGLFPAKIKEEIEKWEKAAKQVLGREYVDRMRQNFPFIRLPGASGRNDPSVLTTIAKMGYCPIAWSADTYSKVLKNHNLGEEPVPPIADEVCRYLVSVAQNGLIVLQHFNIWDVLDLNKIIDGIRKKGLRITTITNVLRKEDLENMGLSTSTQKPYNQNSPKSYHGF